MKKYKVTLVLLLISIVVMTIFSESSPLYKLNPWSDANIYLTIGRSILSGGKLYTDLFDHKGPILYFIYTLLSLISNESFIGVYLLEIVCLFVFLYYSNKILDLFSHKNHLLPITAIAVIITTSNAFSFGGGSVEELFLPIFQATNYICLNKMTKHESFKLKECILIGIFASISFLTKFTLSGYYLGVAICLLIYQYRLDKKKVLPCISYTFLSFIVIFLITCIYFLCNHNINDFIDTYFKFNLFSYTSPISFTSRIITMIKAILFYLKNNILLVSLSLCSILYVIIHFNKNYITLYVLSTCICWYFISFIGSKFIAYYILPIGIYSIYLVLFLDKYKYTHVILVALSIVSIITSSNIKDIARENYVQYEFSEIIGDSSMLVYEGYDQGFYMTSHTTPACKYFTTTNGWLPNYEEDTLSCINENEIEYLISMDNELELDNYELVQEVVQEYDSRDRTYRLYKLVK